MIAEFIDVDGDGEVDDVDVIRIPSHLQSPPRPPRSRKQSRYYHPSSQLPFPTSPQLVDDEIDELLLQTGGPESMAVVLEDLQRAKRFFQSLPLLTQAVAERMKVHDDRMNVFRLLSEHNPFEKMLKVGVADADALVEVAGSFEVLEATIVALVNEGYGFASLEELNDSLTSLLGSSL